MTTILHCSTQLRGPWWSIGRLRLLGKTMKETSQSEISMNQNQVVPQWMSTSRAAKTQSKSIGAVVIWRARRYYTWSSSSKISTRRRWHGRYNSHLTSPRGPPWSKHPWTGIVPRIAAGTLKQLSINLHSSSHIRLVVRDRRQCLIRS